MLLPCELAQKRNASALFTTAHCRYATELIYVEERHRRLHLPTQSQHADKMPSEVQDIKQFIEICRRKDATCMLEVPRTKMLIALMLISLQLLG